MRFRNSAPGPTLTLSGGGYAQAQLTHALAAALWITGQRGTEVAAFMNAPLDAPVELHDAMILRFDDGAIGSLSGRIEPFRRGWCP